LLNGENNNMAYTDNLRKQHNEIVQVVRDITVKLGNQPLDATGMRSLLSRLAGQVVFHLAMEDESLYPRLAASDDQTAKGTATKFMQEMGGVAEVFTSFSLADRLQ
jgi:iron-sulfur cluster repair protein YtfE (RIC family)